MICLLLFTDTLTFSAKRSAADAARLASYFPSLVTSSIDAVSRVPSVDEQLAVLQRTKGLAEAVEHLIVEANESSGSDYEIHEAAGKF